MARTHTNHPMPPNLPRALHSDWAGTAVSLRSHALICTQIEQMERAMDLFRASVRLQPDDDYTHSQAVVTSQHLKRYDDALWHARAALKIKPLPEYHLDVGSALVKLGRYTEAQEHLKIATTQMPASASAHVEMGLCCMGLGNSKEAPKWLERGVELGGGDFRLWLLAAGQHVKSGDHAAARRGYEKAVKACEAAREQLRGKGNGSAVREDECVLAEGRALEHRQRSCDWAKWSRYSKMEAAILARTSEERVLTPFQVLQYRPTLHNNLHVTEK